MKYIIKKNDDAELMHSDEYLNEEFDDELYHYKYVDKYKSKSGKWVYIYRKLRNAITGKDYKSRITNAKRHYQDSVDRVWGDKALPNSAYTRSNQVADFHRSVDALDKAWDDYETKSVAGFLQAAERDGLIEAGQRVIDRILGKKVKRYSGTFK